MAKRITDTTIKALVIKDKEYTFTVEEGLQLRIRPKRSDKGTGTKAWQFKYRHPVTRKITKMAMGTYPSLRLAAAKLEAAEYRKQIAEGIDPKRSKENKRIEELRKHNDSFLEISTMWFDRKRKSVSSFHAERIWRTLEKYVFDHLGTLPVSDITRRDAIEILRPLEKDGKLSTIKRICQSLNQIMEYAVASDVISANPLTKMINSFEKHKVEHMPTIRPELLGELMTRLSKNDSIQDKTKLLLLWQLHTISRPKEAARTRWKDIDFKKQCWTIPAEEMKRKREHRIPLTKQAINILEKIKAHSTGKEFVFPSERNPDGHISVYTANAALKRSLGFKNELVAHGLRAIASTALHEQGFDTLHIEACLSHMDKNVTRASYNRSDFFEQRKEIMCWWSEFVITAASNYKAIDWASM
ncbi:MULTISPECIES: tyrosine-type recombinase/integrase [Vibrio harveyi group]|uniref:tyrosine-type recombinase/integrase n=1 Tax=Vibrio harveyi group TaxID=717610 RepID=UPI000543A499|nr:MULTISPECIES: tyrosine-type recombinase/integrase [Vibrio harveyi group]EHR5764713.1 tyrosine-type recombinase/integrase [Vibrio parahaemolyticus]EHY0932679.1 tyrosine-type recombinase/integrase [Vibrio parahaemolyticus]EIZ0307868.1 tyrosine-type recombinase/integrase [Vibrio parahaemolyticus]EJE8515520.1 tyrosine-type recombinase/integrase [Vibrio parahaemolyticus]EJE8774349.1 tyrosine-type recombinase/integrase [Vibrio parahaemolyticus]